MFHKTIRSLGALLLLTGMAFGEDTLAAGTYKGEWSGAAANGEIHMTFRAGADGKLVPEVGFTLGGQEVSCKIVSFAVEGAKVTLVYEFDAQGTLLKSAAQATVKGKTMEGTYTTTAGDQPVDSGTWKATAP